MSSSRHYESDTYVYRQEINSPQLKEQCLKSSKSNCTPPGYNLSTQRRPSYTQFSMIWNNIISRKRSTSSKKSRGSGTTSSGRATDRGSFQSDLSSSTGRSFCGFFKDGSDHGRPQTASINSDWIVRPGGGFAPKVVRQKRRTEHEFEVDVRRDAKVKFNECRSGRRGFDSEPHSRHRTSVLGANDLVEQVRQKLTKCSLRAVYQSPRRRYGDRRASKFGDDFYKCKLASGLRGKGSPLPEGMRSPYQTFFRSTQSTDCVKSVDWGSESSSSNSAAAARHSHYNRRRSRTSKSSGKNCRQASSAERDLSYRRRRRHDPSTRESPVKYSSRRSHYMSRGHYNENSRRSSVKSRKSKGGDCPIKTRWSKSQRRSKKSSRKRLEFNKRVDVRDARNSPSSTRKCKPWVKVSDLLPECRLRNIEARGGTRDFRKWFTTIPPNVKVDKDLRTDKGVFRKDNFQHPLALDKYLGLYN